MKSKVIVFLFIAFAELCSFVSKGQPSYENDFLSAPFHQNRREVLRKLIPDSSVCILFSAPERNRSNDNDYEYHQSPDFYYLTGFNQPNALVMIFKNTTRIFGDSTKEILFIPPRNNEKEIWTGKMISVEEAKANSGIQSVYTTTEFQSLPLSNRDFNQVLITGIPKGVVDSKSDTNDLFDLLTIFKSKFSYPSENLDTYLLSSALKKLREIKQPEEIELMKKAINITCEGHSEMMKSLKPGLKEYQVQAVGEYVFKSLGAESVGYPSICGGGENSCILHYVSNRKTLKDGELIVLDMGAEYKGYSADVTRTLPVSGVFSNEQKLIYELVEKARAAALSKCLPGNNFRDPHNAAVESIKTGLVSLGIIKDANDYRKYFMHGTSHYLGLDVHDAGTFTALKPGNVITVEPGIYIPSESPCDPKWWNIGVRIEDDVLITDSAYDILSTGCPTESKEIESLMKQSPRFLIPLTNK